MSEIVIALCALLVVGKCGLLGWRAHVWLDEHAPQLGATLPNDTGALVGLALGILLLLAL